MDRSNLELSKKNGAAQQPQFIGVVYSTRHVSKGGEGREMPYQLLLKNNN